jgi:hypothetical protein
MVAQVFTNAAADFALLAQQKDPVLEQLDPPRRAAVIIALLALVLTGLFLVVAVMVGAHWVRRLARHKPGNRSSNIRETAVQNERLRDALASVLPEAKTSDTMQLGKSPGETKVDL